MIWMRATYRLWVNVIDQRRQLLHFSVYVLLISLKKTTSFCWSASKSVSHELSQPNRWAWFEFREEETSFPCADKNVSLSHGWFELPRGSISFIRFRFSLIELTLSSSGSNFAMPPSRLGSRLHLFRHSTQCDHVRFNGDFFQNYC